MLRLLHFINFGLFREVKIECWSGFQAITGESGSGKSQLLSGLETLLGGRWDSTKLGGYGDACQLRAEFEIGESHPAWDLLSDFGVEPDDVLLLRRDINGEGRSLFRAQGQTVPRQVVGDLMPLLVEFLHQGHVARFGDTDAWSRWLDRYLKLDNLVAQTMVAFATWQAGLAEEDALRVEMLDHQDWTRLAEELEEIDAAEIVSGEDSALHDQLGRIRSMNRMAEAYQKVFQLLDEEVDGGIVSRLRSLDRELTTLVQIDPRIDRHRESVLVSLEAMTDVRHGLQAWWEDLDRDPEAQERVEARSDVIAHLKRRFGPELLDVLQYADRVRSMLDRHASLNRQLVDLGDRVRELEGAYRELAGQLSEARASAAFDAGWALAEVVQALEMPLATIEIRISPGAARPRGTDIVSVWFSANAGIDPGPLPKSASGGELARVALGMSALLQDGPDVTMLLDEVDTGLGGRSAARVGRMLSQLGRRQQVLAITHQPVVAAAADHQIVLQKNLSRERTEAQAVVIDGEARVLEVARMLSGGTDQTALDHARQLLTEAISADIER